MESSLSSAGSSAGLTGPARDNTPTEVQCRRLSALLSALDGSINELTGICNKISGAPLDGPSNGAPPSPSQPNGLVGTLVCMGDQLDEAIQRLNSRVTYLQQTF